MGDRKKKLKEVAPHIWSMYQNLTSVRSTLENRLNYFLAIDALLLVGFLQLFGREVKSFSVEYFIPCILLFLPIPLLLLNFVAKQMRGAWMDFDDAEMKLAEVIDKD